MSPADRAVNRRHFDHEIVAFLKDRCRLGQVFFGNDVVGWRCCVGQHNIRFAVREQPIGFRPTLGHSHDLGGKTRPCGLGLITVNGVHPKHEREARDRGSWVLDHNAHVVGRVQQRLKTVKTIGLCVVVDERRVPVIERQERIVVPVDWQRQR